MYPPHHLGGYEIVWQGLMRYVRGEGCTARVLTTGYHAGSEASEASEDPDVHRELRWYWREHHWLELGPLGRLALERHNARVFDAHVRDLRPELIAWWALGGMSLSLIERARRKGIPALFFVHDPWPIYGPQRDLWTRMFSRRPGAATVADHLTGIPTRLRLAEAGRWVFNSRGIEAQTLDAGLPVADRTVLTPGIEESFIQAPRDRELASWRWRLLYVGRVVEQKGVDTAIEALALLPDETTLTVLGEGDEEYRHELERLAERLGVEDRLLFAPPQPRTELFGAYREADAVVFPVKWDEPWGLVPLEAMALGRPVVATGTGGSGEYLRDGENSLLFAVGNAAELAQAVIRLADDQPLRARLLEAGYATAARHSEREFNERALREMQLVLACATASPRRNSRPATTAQG
jgi:glycogen synthase